MTYDHNQLEIPDSFMALFIAPGRARPSETRQFITARYELCEDLATHLVEQARARHLDMDMTQDAVLAGVLEGLRAEASGMTEREAGWTVRRLAELEGWDWSAQGVDRP